MVLILEVVSDSSSQNQIVFANDAFERKTGYHLSEIMGKTTQMLHGVNTQFDELDRITAALDRGETVHTELINYTKSGGEFWVEIDIVPISDERKKLPIGLLLSEISLIVKMQKNIFTGSPILMY